ncbi:MAG TPA: class I SAM-dependent methyltransferase [Acidimicrobiales bacterium]|nr:class I SAM-dependent methyltransferase [Acidimicrobiales bacterium]
MTPSTRWTRTDAPRGAAYDRGFEQLAASGVDVHGEASFVSSYAPASVLDAGCGTGRVAIELARRGMDVVGVDLDPAMLGAARRKAPTLTWVHADLSTLELGRSFDVVVMAGNVLLFVAPGSETAVVERLGAHLVPGGVLVAGFSLGSGVALADYDAIAAAAGLVLESRFSTWERDAFVEGGDYAVSVHRVTGPQLPGWPTSERSSATCTNVVA